MASEAYAKTLRRKLSLAHIWVRYGHLLKERGAFARAESAYRRAIALQHDLADTHYHLASLLNKLGRSNEASEAFAHAVTLDAFVDGSRSKQVRKFVRKGDIGRDMRNWRIASEAYAQALQRNPSLAHIWVQYGHVLKESGDIAQAEDAYRRAIALQPNVADTHYHLGSLLNRLGRFDAGNEAFARALALDTCGDGSRIEQVRMLVRKGDIGRDMRNWQVACEAYAQALQRDPSLADIWVQYGHALKESGDLAGAEVAYRRAIASKPNVLEPHFHLASLLNRLNRFREAKQVMDQAAVIHRAKQGSRSGTGIVARKHLTVRPSSLDLPQCLRFVIIGSTGLCNASCIHCPTGKAETADAPRMPMSMKLFEHIFETIVDLDLPITDQISLGLFGDALVDPWVVQRVAFLRSLLPFTRISVNTNGAAFNPQRHKELAEHVSCIALHVESLVPETYDFLMQPLRLNNVLPKFEAILEMFPGKVVVSVPASRRNFAELPAIKAFFLEHGAAEVVFDALFSRCNEDLTLFNSLALNPQLVRCLPEVLDDLIIDCDGLVLACCQDFRRLEPIGDLAKESLSEVLANAQRRKVRELFTHGRHAERTTCSRCYAD
ncbi:MAG TPA: tetratricopeptide repeat protein, partial [Methylocella sp.]|nr:tetratricopeptide repeat protein [Methylocella sp.]